MQKYLLVIDMQKDFIDGALGTKEAVAILPRVRDKINEYKSNGDKIIFTRDTHFDDYLNTNEGKYLPVTHCIKNTDGWQIYNGIYTDGAEIIDKLSFGYTDWAKHITDDDGLQIELIGLCTDICVVSNALILKALFPDATVCVDPSACAGVTPDTHNAALDTMKMCQVEVKRYE